MKMYGTDNKHIVGTQGENKFEKYVASSKLVTHYELVRATAQDDIYRGIDYYLIDKKNGNEITLDVKNKKSNMLYVETWKNFRTGLRGWLYLDAKFIVFIVEDKNTILWVQKSKLREFVEKGIADETLFEWKRKDGYRDGEAILKIEYDEMCDIAYKIEKLQ